MLRCNRPAVPLAPPSRKISRVLFFFVFLILQMFSYCSAYSDYAQNLCKIKKTKHESLNILDFIEVLLSWTIWPAKHAWNRLNAGLPDCPLARPCAVMHAPFWASPMYAYIFFKHRIDPVRKSTAGRLVGENIGKIRKVWGMIAKVNGKSKKIQNPRAKGSSWLSPQSRKISRVLFFSVFLILQMFL